MKGTVANWGEVEGTQERQTTDSDKKFLVPLSVCIVSPCLGGPALEGAAVRSLPSGRRRVENQAWPNKVPGLGRANDAESPDSGIGCACRPRSSLLLPPPRTARPNPGTGPRLGDRRGHGCSGSGPPRCRCSAGAARQQPLCLLERCLPPTLRVGCLGDYSEGWAEPTGSLNLNTYLSDQ